MENRFDALAKSLADSVSRREAMSRLGGGLAGILLAAVGLEKAWGVPGTGKTPDCGNACNAAFNPTAKATKAQNQHCKQTCLACEGSGGVTCGIATDGTVGCCSGATPVCCASDCTDLSSDRSNCGACGNVCPAPVNSASVFCSGGTCDFTCDAGFTRSGNTCVACTGNGGTCGGNTECCSGNCSNGFCCDPGQVGLSNGTCATPCSTNSQCQSMGCADCFEDASGETYCGGIIGTTMCGADSNCPTGQFCAGATCTEVCGSSMS